MKTLLTLFIAALLAAGADAQTKSANTVKIGSFWFESARFKNASAVVESVNTIRFTETDPTSRQRPIELPWSRVPMAVRVKLAGAVDQLVETQQAVVDKLEKEEALKKAGFEWVLGKVIGRTPEGFLANPPKSDLIIHITGKTDKADGESFMMQCKRDGLYEYTTVLGAKSTVRNYVLP